MCAIAGILAFSPAAARPTGPELARMIASQKHRGPDRLVVFRDGPLGLGHARLAIVDAAGGGQPMTDASKRHAMVYNGEVFNYLELREELRAEGRTFRTESDTEVVLQAYLAWGEAAFRRFDGQFALAIWDREARTLTLARDRLGVRPLHVCRHAGRVYFASEAKAIFAADPTIPTGFDPDGLDQLFTFWSVIAPRTAFAAVEELRPGYVRTYELGSGEMREHAWRALSFARTFSGHVADAAREVRTRLERAVGLRMLRSDVPVGAYLSGGLDSALMAALAARAKPRFSTFSIRFEDAEYDESRFQQLVARELWTDHHEILVTRADIAGVFPDVVRHAERPLLRTAPAPLFLLSRAVHAAGIRVVVTGEGADEMFAGYDLFREGKVRRAWARHPSSNLRPRLLERLYPYLGRSPVASGAMANRFFGQDLARAGEPGFAHGTRWRTTAAVKRLFSKDLRSALVAADAPSSYLASLPPGFPHWTPLGQDQYVEIETLLSGYLLSAQGDRMSLAHAVEGRYPFLDTDLVDLATSLPDRYLLRVLDEKHVLKRAARGLVPEVIVRRPKQPYRAPDALAFTTGAGRELAEEMLAPRAVARAGVFDAEAITKLLAKCIDRASSGQLSNADNMAFIGALSTQLLHHEVARGREVRPVQAMGVELPEAQG